MKSDKEIFEKAKKHQKDFPDNSPYRSYKTGYYHAIQDIELEVEKLNIEKLAKEYELNYFN